MRFFISGGFCRKVKTYDFDFYCIPLYFFVGEYSPFLCYSRVKSKKEVFVIYKKSRLLTGQELGGRSVLFQQKEDGSVLTRLFGTKEEIKENLANLIDAGFESVGNLVDRTTKGASAFYEAAVIGKSMAQKEAVQNVVGILVSEYYGKEKDFAQNPALVKELQCNLIGLGYDLGNTGSGKNGADGDLGSKTKSAICNFEQDYAPEIKAAVKNATEIRGELNKGRSR
jgi:hypothetical protein